MSYRPQADQDGRHRTGTVSLTGGSPMGLLECDESIDDRRDADP
ncbi:hypothetical protein AB7C87_00850 [Natrarchaeobius sp. A-rgal3]